MFVELNHKQLTESYCYISHKNTQTQVVASDARRSNEKSQQPQEINARISD